MQAPVAIVGGGPAGLSLAGVLERGGIDYTVYERGAENVAPRGGCLDIHRGEGQVVLKEAGCFDEFKKYARGGYATTHWVWDHKGNKIFPFGEGRDSPEMDRAQLQRTLLSSIPKHKVRWSAGVKSSSRDEKGDVVLEFDDGTTASGFRLVVGADGVWSKIRHLVTPAVPKYSGIVIVTGFVHHSHPSYETLEGLAGQGPMVVLGRSKLIWVQRQGAPHYRIDFGWPGPADFPAKGEVDLSKDDDVRKFLLGEDYFAGHASQTHDMIKACVGPFRTWPLYYFPPEQLNWKPAPDVTLVGDAAHVTTPFVGDGVNLAMVNALSLAQKLQQFGITQEAVTRYEEEMFPKAFDVITRSVASGEYFFQDDSPRGFMEMMASDNRLVHLEDDS